MVNWPSMKFSFSKFNWQKICLAPVVEQGAREQLCLVVARGDGKF